MSWMEIIRELPKLIKAPWGSLLQILIGKMCVFAKKAYNANRKFLHFAIEGYLVLLAMKMLDFDDKDDELSTNLLGDRNGFDRFDRFVKEIVDNHIYSYLTPELILGKVTLNTNVTTY